MPELPEKCHEKTITSKHKCQTTRIVEKEYAQLDIEPSTIELHQCLSQNHQNKLFSTAMKKNNIKPTIRLAIISHQMENNY